MSAATNTCGCRPPRQLITNNAPVPILGSDLLQGNEVTSNAIHDTMSKAMAPETRKITKIVSRFIEYLKEHLMEYHQLGVREVTHEDQTNCLKYDSDKKEDLINSGLNVNLFMYFVAPKIKTQRLN
jgi:hypothetical protein